MPSRLTMVAHMLRPKPPLGTHCAFLRAVRRALQEGRALHAERESSPLSPAYAMVWQLIMITVRATRVFKNPPLDMGISFHRQDVEGCLEGPDFAGATVSRWEGAAKVRLAKVRLAKVRSAKERLAKVRLAKERLARWAPA